MKRPGAVLEAGTILAKLELDDPSQMKRVRFIEYKKIPLCLHLMHN